MPSPSISRQLVRLLVCAAIAQPALVRAAPAATPPHENGTTTLPSRLTLGESLKIFRDVGFDMLIAEAAVASAEGDVRIAHAVQNPLVNGGVGLSEICSANGGGSGCRWDRQVAWTVGISDQAAIENALSGKRGLRANVAESALAAARLQRDDARRTLEGMVKEAFLQVAFARDALAFAKDVAESNKRTLDLMSVRYKSGAISEADVARVETAKLEADQQLDLAGQALHEAKLQLGFLLGVRGSPRDYDVDAEDLAHFRVPAALEKIDSDALLERALGNRPDLRALRHQSERAQASISLAQRLRFPDVALSLQYSQQGAPASNPQTPPTLILGLTAALPVFYQAQGEIQKAEADYRTQLAEGEKLKAQVVSEVAGAFHGFETSRQLVTRMEQGGLLERSKRAFELVSVQYQKGAASLLEFLDAQRTYNSTRLEYLQDILNYWTSVFRLEQAVGTELRS